MSNRTLFWMTGLMILCVGLLLFLNTMPLIMTLQTEKYLKLNDVRGMAVEHKQKLYTLNFDQQNAVIGFLNKSTPISTASVPDKKPKLEISKIVIYRFDLPNLTIVPIEYSGENLIFSSPDWNKDGFMKDNSNGELKNILSQTFDP